MPSMILLLRLIATVIAVSLIYAGQLYETEEGKLQSRLEDLWIKVDDVRGKALSGTTVFLKVVAQLFNSLLNRIFGEKLVSFRALTISCCYAIATTGVLPFLVLLTFSDKGVSSYFPEVFIIYFSIGTIPVLLKREKWVTVWQTVIVTIFLWEYLIPFIQWLVLFYLPDKSALFWLILLFGLGIAISFILYFLFVIVARWSLRRIADSNALVKIVFICLYNIIPIIVFIVIVRILSLTLDYTLPTDIELDKINAENVLSDWGQRVSVFFLVFVIAAFFVNSIFLFSTLLFVFLAIILLLHRLIWPIIQRPLYALQRLEIAKRNKLLVRAGLLLLISVWGGLSWAKELLEMLIDRK
jgi:hypothetical protein